jgi:hypothetical protein
MSSRAAAAMYPALAKAEDQRQAELRGRSDKSAEPAWGKSNDPIWAEPRAAPPKDYSRVPGLRKVNR